MLKKEKKIYTVQNQRNVNLTSLKSKFTQSAQDKNSKYNHNLALCDKLKALIVSYFI